MSARIAEAAALSLSSFLKSEDTEGESSEPDFERAGSEDESSDLDNEWESYGLDDESHALDDEGYGLDDEAVSEPLGLGYGATRHRALESTKEIAPSMYEVDPEDGRVYTDIPTYVPPAAPVQTPPSPEWSSGSLPVSLSSPVVPSPIASPVATPTATISRENHDLRRQIVEERHERLVCPIVNAPVGRLLGAYDLRVATPRAVVHAGDKTSRNARSWYMISGDAKSWVVCFDKGKWMVLEIKDVHPWGFGI
ncbi:hypothetical protein Tco_0944008 [Tanacetum coccineum]